MISTEKKLKNHHSPALLSHFLKTLSEKQLINPLELPLLSPFFSQADANNSFQEILTFSNDESQNFGYSPNFNPLYEQDQFNFNMKKNKPMKAPKIKDFLNNGLTPSHSHCSKLMIKISSNASFQKSWIEFSRYSPFSLESSLDLKGIGESRKIKKEGHGEKDEMKGDRSYIKQGRMVWGRSSF